MYYCNFAVTINNTARIMKILIKPVIALQKRQNGVSYRLMHYVVKQEVEEGVLLYNTLTCSLVLVSGEESQRLIEVEGLVENWFMVPEDYNEKHLCKIMRIGAKLQNSCPKGINGYTIVTTTGCNARCAYCFEQGVKPVNMTRETAEKVAQYIISHRGEHKEVDLRWFGGEPLYNVKVLDVICNYLKERGVNYKSNIVTNGYLLGERNVNKAVALWNVKKVQITIDGTEEKYNRIKAFVHTNGKSAYGRVMENIKRLLETTDIKLTLRIHLSNDNIDDVWALTKELGGRFHGYDNLRIYYRPIFETCGPMAQIRSTEQRQTIYEEKKRLQTYVGNLGFKGKSSTRKLRYEIMTYHCMVDSEKSVVVMPDGHLGLCEHYLDSYYIGSINSEDWNQDIVRQLREYQEELPECNMCAYYPQCLRPKSCTELQYCSKEWREDNIYTIRQQMLGEYHAQRGCRSVT